MDKERDEMTDSPATICYFSNSDARGGVEEHILTLLRRLDRSLFRPILICAPPCAEKLSRDLPEDVTVFPLSFERPYQIWRAARFGNILRHERVSILHSHLFNASLAASPVGRLCGVPAIIETTHLREGWRHGWIKGTYAIDRVAGRFVDHYVAVSEANARYLIEEKGVPARKVHVIHNGCDLSKFKPGHRVPEGMKKALAFGELDPILLAVGRLEPQKGHRFLLEAHTRVLSEFPNARLVCVGEGALRGELEKQTEALGIQSAVRFVGFQSNVLDWLALADVSVLPSLFEGLPLVAIETLAFGCPMVATAVDGTVEVIVEGKSGLTVPPGNSAKLAEAILRCLRNPERARELALQGRQQVLEHFTQEQQIRKTEELYRQALQQRAKSRKATMSPAQSSRIAGEARSFPRESNSQVAERK
ncbi:MAG: glycosyltransferase family 4 protein [Candidatus Acidiferrales bacterium]